MKVVKVKREKTDMIHDIITAVLAAIMLLAVVISVFPKFSSDEAEDVIGDIYSLNRDWRLADGSRLEFPFETEEGVSALVLENTLAEEYVGMLFILTSKNAVVKMSVSDADGNFHDAYDSRAAYKEDDPSFHPGHSINHTMILPDLDAGSVVRVEFEKIREDRPVVIENCRVTRSDTLLIRLIELSLPLFLCFVIIIVCAFEMYIADLIKVFAGWGKWETPFLILFGILSIVYVVSNIDLIQALLGNTDFFTYLCTLSLCMMTPVMTSYLAGREEGKRARVVKGAVWLFLILITIAAITFSDNDSLRRIIMSVSANMLSFAVFGVIVSGGINLFKSKNKQLLPELFAFVVLFFGALHNGIAVLKEKKTGTGDYTFIMCTAVFFVIMTASGIVRIVREYRRRTEKAEKEAIAASEAKSSFLSSMSHEIRTPINAVLGMNEMILRECEDETILGYSEKIRGAGSTLLGLINDILDFSKIEAGKLDILPVDYDLASLLNDMVTMIHMRAEKKGLALELDIDENIPKFLHGDEIRIKQVISNILTNAVKYTEKGSVKLTMSCEKTGDKSILLSVSVRDTGIGIKKEDMSKLFVEFERIEETRNRSIEGTGLGMNITQRLLAMMGGSLKVESEYGKGSVFSFALSQEVVRWEAVGDYEESFRRSLGSREKYRESFTAPDARILVVDDTAVNLEVFKNLLKKTLVRIDTAQSGADCLELAAAQDYDAVFIDHMMPDMDGVETLQHLRKAGRNKDVIAVALTANAVSGARESYLAAGFDEYLSKPVDGAKLEKILLGILPQEKIQKPQEAAAGAQADPAADPQKELDGSKGGLPEWLQDITGLDVQAGVKNCGGAEGYLSVLMVFHQTAAAKADEIEQYYTQEDIENYTIKVHALKSSARIIGAAKLSALAAELESAGKEKNTDFIRLHSEELLGMYRKLGKSLENVLAEPEQEELAPIDAAERREAYQTIAEIAQSMDYGMMTDIMGDLRQYDLPPQDRENMKKIEGLLNSLDWDGIAKLAGRAAADMEG